MDLQTRATLSKDLARLKDGDRAASRPVFEKLWPALTAFAGRSLDEAQAEEAAQRALIRMFAQVDRYDVERDALSWAFALTVWEVRSLTRDHARGDARSSTITEELAASSASADTLVIDRELRALLDRALATLNESDRRAIIEMLEDADPDVPLSARLRQRRHRAVARLRTMWRDLHGTP